MTDPVRFLKSAEEEYFSLPLQVQNDILEKIKLLREFPYIGRAMEEPYQGYRSLLAFRGRYRIIYQVLDNNCIEVAYIRHCRRQMGLRLVT